MYILSKQQKIDDIACHFASFSFMRAHCMRDACLR